VNKAGFLYSFDMLEWGSPFVFSPKKRPFVFFTIGGNVSIWRFQGQLKSAWSQMRAKSQVLFT
jgi:hypothetical protein